MGQGMKSLAGSRGRAHWRGLGQQPQRTLTRSFHVNRRLPFRRCRRRRSTAAKALSCARSPCENRINNARRRKGPGGRSVFFRQRMLSRYGFGSSGQRGFAKKRRFAPRQLPRRPEPDRSEPVSSPRRRGDCRFSLFSIPMGDVGGLTPNPLPEGHCPSDSPLRFALV